MSLAIVSAASSAQVGNEVAKLTTPAPAAQSSSAALQQDTVNISAAGHAASSAGDVDHDGDSR